MRETDRLGNVTEYAYDNSGNRTLITYPDGKTEKFVYNSQNQVSQKINRDGRVDYYGYDSRYNHTTLLIGGIPAYIKIYDSINNLIEEKDVINNTTDRNGCQQRNHNPHIRRGGQA